MRPLAVLTVLALVCCFQGDLMMPSTEESTTTIVSVDSTNLRFTPSTVSIDEGDTVRFFWGGQSLPHNAVETNEVFNSGEPERAVDYSFTFEFGTAGTYDFFCEPHQSVGMVGQVIVEPAEANATENESEAPAMVSEDTPYLGPLAVGTITLLAAVFRRQQD